MSRLRFTISMSLDGFVGGPGQSLQEPLGIRWDQLDDWVVGEREHASALRDSHQHRRHDHGRNMGRHPGLVGGARGAAEGMGAPIRRCGAAVPQ
jgi:hypothetical protein